MMAWTTSECRQLHRLLTQSSLLYSEMVTTGAILYGDRERFLRFDPSESPLVLQLGGHEPAALAQCTGYAQQYGYDQVNLNVGCPSDRVQNGMIGAILMKHAHLVADGLKAMRDAASLPVSIKLRIGVDDHDSYEFLRDFVGMVAKSGCDTFIVHARLALLSGLTPKQNREIPPLDHQRVLRLKRDFPALNIIINGGIKSHEQGLALVKQGLDGIMVGREAYQNPLLLRSVDQFFFDAPSPHQTPAELNDRLLSWVAAQCALGTPLKRLVKPMLGLYNGYPGAKKFRRLLSDTHRQEEIGEDLVRQALAEIRATQF